jgi:hypothetical protein
MRVSARICLASLPRKAIGGAGTAAADDRTAQRVAEGFICLSGTDAWLGLDRTKSATGLTARRLSAPTARETRGPYNLVPPAQIKSGVLPIGIRATRQMG